MIHLLKLKNGTDLEISQIDRDSIVRSLGMPKESRPDFIEIESAGAVISVSSIAAIIRSRLEPERILTQEEELAAFNEQWDKDHPKG